MRLPRLQGVPRVLPAPGHPARFRPATGDRLPRPRRNGVQSPPALTGILTDEGKP